MTGPLRAVALAVVLAVSAALAPALTTPAAARPASARPVEVQVTQAIAPAVQVTALAPGASAVADSATLRMQTDGNLVLHRAGRVVWHTGTPGHPGARFVAQGDGNLVVYGADGRALWHSRTAGLGATDLRLDAAGLVLRAPSGRAVWREGTYLGAVLPAGGLLRAGEQLLAPARGYRLVLQADGNLVLYRTGGPATWSSRTAGSGADSLRVQADGHVVLYAGSRAVWHTVSLGTPAPRLVVQDDGNTVLYGSAGPVWDTAGRTGGTARWVLPAFAATVSTVSAAQLGASWRDGCPVGPASLRLVRVSYVTLDGAPATGELVVHADLATPTVEVFRRLHGLRFPLGRVVPVSAYGGSDAASMDANNTSAFNCRRTTGGTAWSEHSYGRGIDVNPVQNPYVSGSTVLPAAGRAYLDRAVVRPGMVTSAVVQAFAASGFVWGGTWSSVKDYQHFSTTGR